MYISEDLGTWEFRLPCILGMGNLRLFFLYSFSVWSVHMHVGWGGTREGGVFISSQELRVEV